MGPAAKWEYMKAVYTRYLKADRKAKKLILDEFCRTYKCHRKHAIRLLNRPQPTAKRPARRRRPSRYDGRLVAVLEKVWEASGYLWSRRLKAALPLWMPWIRRRLAVTPEMELQLLAISPAQIDRRLKAVKWRARKRVYGATKPGRLLKQHIPIKTDCWDIDKPGFVEIDLVSHAGKTALGDFAHTLDVTDVFSGWVERRCVLGKGQAAVLAALDDIRKHLPFPLLAIDSDNGSEFINKHLYRYCQAAPKVQFTRGRPYKKDDNAHVEQKNWTHVRKVIGYGRYDCPQAITAISDLYRHELRCFQNLFQPSVKLIRKTRVGAKLRRQFEPPKTPLERIIESGLGKAQAIDELLRLRASLDPFELSHTVDRKLAQIHAMANNGPIRGQTNRWIMPTFRDQRLSGPPHEPASWPGVERYEGLLRREAALQTW